MASQSVQTIRYNIEEFPFLAMSEEIVPGQQSLGIEQLGDEGESLVKLCDLAGTALEDITYDNLLFVEADADGILQKLYGPAVWAAKRELPDGSTETFLVLRVGANIFPITQEPGKLTCGELTARGIEFETRKNAKDECFLAASIVWRYKKELLIIVDVRLDGKKNPTKTENDCLLLKTAIQDAVEEGQPLTEWLMEAGSGSGGKTVKMHELGSGEFLIESITTLILEDRDNPGATRTTYVLNLAGGLSTYAKGNSQRILEDPQKRWEASLLKQGKAAVKQSTSDKVAQILELKCDVTLQIGEITETSRGFSVANRLVPRQPILAGSTDAGHAVLAPAQPVRQLAAAAVGANDAQEELPF